jgi:hypothetical protein
MADAALLAEEDALLFELGHAAPGDLLVVDGKLQREEGFLGFWVKVEETGLPNILYWEWRTSSVPSCRSSSSCSFPQQVVLPISINYNKGKGLKLR